MGRILALDLGLKRTGIAITDELRLIANPVGTYPTESIFDTLRTLIKEKQVEEVVIGMPKRLNGEDTHATGLVNAFIEQFSQAFSNIPLHIVDERLTSKEAKSTLLMAGYKKNQRKDKSLLDTVSASLILQTYLNTK